MKNTVEKKLLIGFGTFLGSFAGLVIISFAIIAAVALAITTLL